MKYLSGILILIFSCLILSSCAGAGDWTYDELPNNYSVWRNNNRDIHICKMEDETSGITIIDAYVSKIAVDGIYLFAAQVEVPEDLHEEIDTSAPVYYIINTETDEVFGSYSQKEFKEKYEESGFDKKIKWKKTKALK